jgi:hypothetical protein
VLVQLVPAVDAVGRGEGGGQGRADGEAGGAGLGEEVGGGDAGAAEGEGRERDGGRALEGEEAKIVALLEDFVDESVEATISAARERVAAMPAR